MKEKGQATLSIDEYDRLKEIEHKYDQLFETFINSLRGNKLYGIYQFCKNPKTISAISNIAFFSKDDIITEMQDDLEYRSNCIESQYRQKFKYLNDEVSAKASRIKILESALAESEKQQNKLNSELVKSDIKAGNYYTTCWIVSGCLIACLIKIFIL